MGKRSFLKIILSLATVLLSGLMSWAVAKYASFSGDKAKSREIPKTVIDGLQPGLPVHYPDAGVWLVKQAGKDQISVFDDKCPHLGCKYNWIADKKVFECPCHGSVFDINGQVKKGPANRAVSALKLSLDEKEIYKVIPASK
ncbi:MAG: ubiquinol-cytochrome c reductase iron-sulfur subunit [Desulfomonilaceae bacterium]